MLAERGHQVAWLTTSPCDTATELGQPLFALPGFWEANRLKRQFRNVEGLIYSRGARTLTEQAVETFRPDVAHIHTIRFTLSPSILPVLKKHGVPVVQTLHDYRLICPVNSFLSGFQVCEACKGKRYYNCARRRCARGRSLVKSAVFSLSAYVADYLYRYDNLITAYIAPGAFLRRKMIEYGYAPAKITTVHNAYFGHADSPRDLPRTHILYVGRLAHEKGIDLLVRAAAGLEVPVVIAGDGPERARLESLADEVGARNVRFVGFQPQEVIADLYSRALVAILPSRWYENGPLVILEAYAQATPVVGADIGAIPEFVEEGQTGLLFRANDADDLRAVLQRCLADREKLAQMGQKARQRVITTYSPEQYVQSLESILESVLA
ncbi:MAG: glycosyltransferase [Promethearchaeota archaeon]